MYDISLKRKWDAEAVRMYQQEQVEGLEKQLEGLEKQVVEANQSVIEAQQAAIEAKAEGQHQKAIETALKLKAMGLSLEQIAEGTGLTIEEIEKLK